MNMKGYLSPKGILYTCESYEHLDLAYELCEEIGFHASTRLDAEDYLMDFGYITIRARDMWMGHRSFQRITKEQFDFFETNKENMNAMQIEYLSKMILEQD